MPYEESNAYPGRGTVVARSDDGSPEAWTAFEEVMSAEPSGDVIDQYEVSNFNSGIDKEFIAGMIDHGEVVFKMNHVPSDAGQQLLRSDFQAGAVHTWGIKLPDSSIVSSGNTVPYYVTFKAFIKELKLPSLTTQAAAESGFTLKITHSITEHQEGTVSAPF